MSVLLLCLALLLLMGNTAAAEPCGTSRLQPACTILRPIPAPGHRWVDESAPECIVTVGGLGSNNNDRFFDQVVAPLVDDPAADRAYVQYRFGWHRAGLYPFNTYGAIADNAEQLRALVRDLSDECYAIDIVAHSMGGVVADRAFSLGLSASDGVLAYLPLSSPHNGAWGAMALRLGVELSDTFAGFASALTAPRGWHDPTTPAVRDLAQRVSPGLPRGVAEVRQRMVNDVVVIRRDQLDRRYDTREYVPVALDQVEGHGGIVHNELAMDVVARTIREHEVPPESRSVAEVKAASFASRAVDHYWGDLEAGVGLALAGVAIGAAALDDDDRALLAERAAAHLPVELELTSAALELEDPVLPTLLKLLFASVIE